MRTTPPSDDEAKGIIQILSERRISVKSRVEKGSRKKEEATTADTQIVSVEEEIQRRKKSLKIPLSAQFSKIDLDLEQEEIIQKMKTAANEFRDLILAGTKVAKEKIKQTQEIVEERQADKDSLHNTYACCKKL